MRLAISHLGPTPYKKETYIWQDKECETDLFAEALAEFFEPDEVCVLITQEVEGSENFEKLRARFAERGWRLSWVRIPKARREEEIWEIFDAYTRKVEEVGEGQSVEVILDITHAFRHLPMVGLAAIAYLRRTAGGGRRIRVERIVYGASEAKDDEKVPVFDLTPILDLFDWLHGVDEFLRRADAGELSERLTEAQARPWRERVGEGREELPRLLQNLAGRLRTLSRALHLSRPLDIMREAGNLLPLLEKASGDVRRWAKPFSVVLEDVRGEVSQLAHERPEVLDRENLRRQLDIIRYFLGKGLTAQAILLAREWLVSWAMLLRGKGNWLDREARGEVERALAAAGRRARGEEADLPCWLEGRTNVKTIGEIWNDVAENLRNDLAHCGLREGAAGAESIEKRAGGVYHRLQALLSETPEGTLGSDRVVIDLSQFYEGTAKLDELPSYVRRALKMAGEGREVVLTGQAPIWLYLAVAHALHGKARRLLYSSPVTGEVEIFDHTPFNPTMARLRPK